MGIHFPGWPGGDSGKLRHAATAWDTFGTALSEAVTDAENGLSGLFADWEGEASTKFASVFNEFAQNNRTAASTAHDIAGRLNEMADKIDEIHTEYEHKIEVAAATVIVSIGLMALTGGLSAGAAAAAVEFIVDLLAEMGIALDGMALAAVEVTADLAATAAGRGFVVGFSANVFEQNADSVWVEGGGLTFDLKSALVYGAAGAAVGGLGEDASMPEKIAWGAIANGDATAADQALHGEDLDASDIEREALIGAVSELGDFDEEEETSAEGTGQADSVDSDLDGAADAPDPAGDLDLAGGVSDQEVDELEILLDFDPGDAGAGDAASAPAGASAAGGDEVSRAMRVASSVRGHVVEPVAAGLGAGVAQAGLAHSVGGTRHEGPQGSE